MNDFLKGSFGYDPVTKKYSTTETMAMILIGLVVVVTVYEMVTSTIFQHYTDLLMYAIGGATGNKVAKGIATTVQNVRSNNNNEGDRNNEDSSI